MFDGHREYKRNNSSVADREYSSVPEDDIDGGRWPILSWECRPGDCVAFYGLTLHGAGGNPSESVSRRVVSLRFVGPSARIAQRPWKPSPPVYGGLKEGQRLEEASNFFPVVWEKDN